jgi:hypothetical protein
MKIVAILVFSLGILVLLSGLFTCFVGASDWIAAACSDVETARSRAEKAAKDLEAATADPSAKDTSVERYFQNELYQRHLDVTKAEKRCEDGKMYGHTLRLYSALVSVFGGLLVATGVVIHFFRKRRIINSQI